MSDLIRLGDALLRAALADPSAKELEREGDALLRAARRAQA